MIRVTTDYVPERKKHQLTAGKVYDAEPMSKGSEIYRLIDDRGGLMPFKTKKSRHLDGRDWEIVK